MADKVVHFRNVALLRRREGLTQEQLASLMDTTQQSVNRWETGAGTPNLKKAIALADIFEVSLDTILGLRPVGPKAPARPTIEEKLLQFKALDEGRGNTTDIDDLTRSVFEKYAKRPEHLVKVCRGIEVVIASGARGSAGSASELVEAVLGA